MPKVNHWLLQLLLTRFRNCEFVSLWFYHKYLKPNFKHDLTRFDPSQLRSVFGCFENKLKTPEKTQQCGQKWCFITKVVFWDTSVVWKFWQWCFHWKGWLFNFDLLISLKWGTLQTFSIFFVKKCIKCHLMWAFFEKNHPISNYFQRLIKIF